MKIIIAVICCLVASINAQQRCGAACRQATPWQSCPPCNADPIPLPPQPNTCLAPTCSNNGINPFLWPHIDPNFFYQCRQTNNGGIGGWEAVRMPCGCQTVFDFREQRCVHLHEWTTQCPGQPQNPTLTPCPTCPDCGPTPPIPIIPNPPVETPCPCVCVPCIWWPCSPCPSSTACCNRQ